MINDASKHEVKGEGFVALGRYFRRAAARRSAGAAKMFPRPS